MVLLFVLGVGLATAVRVTPPEIGLQVAQGRGLRVGQEAVLPEEAGRARRPTETGTGPHATLVVEILLGRGTPVVPVEMA